jgi:hypothetical protein
VRPLKNQYCPNGRQIKKKKPPLSATETSRETLAVFVFFFYSFAPREQRELFGMYTHLPFYDLSLELFCNALKADSPPWLTPSCLIKSYVLFPDS